MTITDLNSLIKRESSMFSRTKKEIQIHGDYEKDLWAIEADQGQIRLVILNLYVNVWQAMPNGGDLYVQTENVSLDEAYVKPYEVAPGRYVTFSVTDTGVGMDETTLQKIFAPFYSTKEIGTSYGLGLASCYGIIKNHDGFINVYSEERKGTTFNIYIPASEKEFSGKNLPSRPLDIQYGRGTLLLVDDEDIVIEAGQKMLEILGYRVFIARSGNEALDICRKYSKEIDLVILDMIMSVMGGGQNYDRLKQINASVRVLLSSGYSLNEQARDLLNRGCKEFIQKPSSLNNLSIKIRKALGRIE